MAKNPSGAGMPTSMPSIPPGAKPPAEGHGAHNTGQRHAPQPKSVPKG